MLLDLDGRRVELEVLQEEACPVCQLFVGLLHDGRKYILVHEEPVCEEFTTVLKAVRRPGT